MADERKDEGKAPHWTSASLTEAAAHPHSPEMKDQGGSGEGLSRSANGFPYREEEEGAFGEHGSQGTYSDTKENGINGELTSADRETAGNEGLEDIFVLCSRVTLTANSSTAAGPFTL